MVKEVRVVDVSKRNEERGKKKERRKKKEKRGEEGLSVVMG